MFRISAIQNEFDQRKHTEACGAMYRPGFFAYAMLDNDTEELMAISQFEIEGEIGYISDIKAVPSLNDFEAMFILGRATMNFMDMCGAHKCRAALDAADEKLLRAIGFKRQENEYFTDMSGMFEGHCDTQTKKLKEIK